MNDTDMMEAFADDRHKLLLASLCLQIDCAQQAWLKLVDELDAVPEDTDITTEIKTVVKEAEVYQDLLFSIFRARRGIKADDL